MKAFETHQDDLIDVVITQKAIPPTLFARDQHGRDVFLRMPLSELSKLKVGKRLRCRATHYSVSAEVVERLDSHARKISFEQLEREPLWMSV